MPAEQARSQRRRVRQVAKRGALAQSSGTLVGEPPEVFPHSEGLPDTRKKLQVGAKPGLPPAEGGRARCFRKADLSGPRLTAGQLGEVWRWRTAHRAGRHEKAACPPVVDAP